MHYFAFFCLQRMVGGVYNDYQLIIDEQKYGKIIQRRFLSQKEANKWLEDVKGKVAKYPIINNETVFCDAGTSRLASVEVRVTDQNGNSVLNKVLPSIYLNDKNNLAISWMEFTNNFGELIAAMFALIYAIKYKKRVIYGDSAIVILFWLSCDSVRKGLNVCTVSIINESLRLYNVFISSGGKFYYISRVFNRADIFYGEIE